MDALHATGPGLLTTPISGVPPRLDAGAQSHLEVVAMVETTLALRTTPTAVLART